MMFRGSTHNSETLISEQFVSLTDGVATELIPPDGAAGYFMQVRPAGGITSGVAFLRYGQAADVAGRLGIVLVAETPDGHWVSNETLNIQKNHPWLTASGADLEAYILWVA